jgi:hypothetical protein
MNTKPYKFDLDISNGQASAFTSADGRILHRIAEVRHQQGVSAKVLTKRLAIKPHELDRQQSPYCDLLLSQLYKWQAALDVPVGELLLDPGHALSPGVDRRARLLKLMKTVRSLQQAADSNPLRVLAAQLADQLIEIMPELVDVDCWPIVGKRRMPDDISPREERLLPDPYCDWTRLSSLDGE